MSFVSFAGFVNIIARIYNYYSVKLMDNSSPKLFSYLPLSGSFEDLFCSPIHEGLNYDFPTQSNLLIEASSKTNRMMVWPNARHPHILWNELWDIPHTKSTPPSVPHTGDTLKFSLQKYNHCIVCTFSWNKCLQSTEVQRIQSASPTHTHDTTQTPWNQIRMSINC